MGGGVMLEVIGQERADGHHSLGEDLAESHEVVRARAGNPGSDLLAGN
jgi:hypothetical protein